MASKFVLQVEDARESLQDLLRACRSERTYQSVVEYLLTIYRRVQKHSKTDYDIRRLMKTDPGFRDNVWRWSAARDFLQTTGWVEVSESLILPTYVDLAKACVLLEKSLQQRGATPSVTSSRSSTSASVTSSRSSTSSARGSCSSSAAAPKSRLRVADDEVFSKTKRASTSTKKPSAIPKRSSTSAKKPSTGTKRSSTSTKRASAIPKRSSTSTRRSSASTRRSSTRASAGG